MKNIRNEFKIKSQSNKISVYLKTHISFIKNNIIDYYPLEDVSRLFFDDIKIKNLY